MKEQNEDITPEVDPAFLRFLGRVQALSPEAKAKLREIVLQECGLTKTQPTKLPPRRR
jgi:hypothetical protein